MSGADLPADLCRIRDEEAKHKLLKKVIVLPEVDSTNLHLKSLAKRGEPEGTVVIADTQTAGRGRQGREWHSPAGKNLYLSLLLRPTLRPSEAPLLAMWASLTLAECIRDAAGVRPGIKWPNDIQLKGRKCAGILMEMDATVEGIHSVVVGIGVNLNMREFPPDLRMLATSVSLACSEYVPRDGFGLSLLQRLEETYVSGSADRFRGLSEQWMVYDVLAGNTVRVDTGESMIEGVVQGYDELGTMLLKADSGEVRRVLAGDVHKVRRS